MLKRILIVGSLFLILGCSKSATENGQLIGGPWTFINYDGNPVNTGVGMHMTFFKTSSSQGAATFTEIDTLYTGIYKKTASYHYAFANGGTEIKFTAEDSAKIIFRAGTGIWHIDNLTSNDLKMTFEDDTTHTTVVELVR